jgi:hypothetical protein
MFDFVVGSGSSRKDITASPVVNMGLSLTAKTTIAMKTTLAKLKITAINATDKSAWTLHFSGTGSLRQY